TRCREDGFALKIKYRFNFRRGQDAAPNGHFVNSTGELLVNARIRVVIGSNHKRSVRLDGSRIRIATAIKDRRRHLLTVDVDFGVTAVPKLHCRGDVMPFIQTQHATVGHYSKIIITSRAKKSPT